jgi:hypothetical protein
MRRYRLLAPMWLGLGPLVLAGCAAQPTGTASLASAPTLQPGMARVWVLRQPSAPGGNVAAADPMVYANGASLAQSAQGTVFFHDFQPGTYRLTVQPYGTRQPRRHPAAGTRDAGLCSGPGGAQLGNGLYRRGCQFCRADDGASGGPTIPSGDEVSRPALITERSDRGRDGSASRWMCPSQSGHCSRAVGRSRTDDTSQVAFLFERQRR